MSLTEARIANGLEAGDPRYGAVSVEVAPRWLRSVWARGTTALSMSRHIYLSEESFRKVAAGRAEELIRHETVHIEQWRRHGRVGFLTRYLGAYLKGRAAGLPHAAAYRSIPFEMEASSRTE